MILVFEVVFALIAAILSILSLKTLKAISHLGVGKSFWIPVFMSGVFFIVGSIVTIFHEMNFPLTNRTDEIAQVSRLLALSVLMFGIYGYSIKVKQNLTKEYSIPGKKESIDMEDLTKDLETEAAFQEKKIQESRKAETTPECKHRFGYLRTLPRDAPIPNECLSCDKIIKCKHSLVNKLESQATDQ